MKTLDPARVHVTPADAEKLTFLGMHLHWLITREMSDGAFAQFLHVSPPGTGVPMHIHHGEDESMYVIEGEVVARVGDRTVTCRAGDALMMPRGVRHGWRVAGEVDARLHFTLDLAPEGDWEEMFRGLVGLAPTDFERIKQVCAPNRIEFLDPPEMP
jgi:quercetin dioxygenase-like cupin family protein